ncbi:MAG: MarR family winged helix-turn-helix transcriptional regulator [Steroidobacteraceae bacterium]
MVVEKRLRARLDEEFKTTLPRFDVLAALERSAQRLNQGLTMSQLSESLMVSNGNVTGVVARLIEDGLVTRTVDQQDRRSATVRLTRKGRDMFLKMAAAHEQWIETMFADLSDNQTADLLRLLTHLRRSIESHPL